MNNDENSLQMPQEQEQAAFDQLEDMFGQTEELEQANQVVLSSDLEGFAHCFPDWDLHPPTRRA